MSLSTLRTSSMSLRQVMLLQFPDTATALDCFEFRESFFFASLSFFNFFAIFAFFLRRHCLPFLPVGHLSFLLLCCFFLLFWQFGSFLHFFSFFFFFLHFLSPGLHFFASFDLALLVPFFLKGTVSGFPCLFFLDTFYIRRLVPVVL